MSKRRFSLTITPMWSDEKNTMVIGTADLSLLFLDPQRAPKGSDEDWILWALHHLVQPKSIPTNESITHQTISPALAHSLGVRIFPGFVQTFAFHEDGTPPEDLHWTYDARSTRDAIYTSQQGSWNPSDILAFKPAMTVPFRDNLPYGQTSYNSQRSEPYDITHMEAALLMGVIAGASITDAFHPVFDLLGILSAMPLPSEKAWTGRSNGTGWSSIYRRSDAGLVNPAVAWGYGQQILRPASVFGHTGFERSARWHQANIATRDMPARGFATNLVAVAEHHAHHIRATKAAMVQAIASERHAEVKLPLPHLSAHDTLAWTSLHTAVLHAGAQAGLF